MKVGILTLLPLNSNYGGVLQVWALQKFISDLGHDPEVFNTPEVKKFTLKEKILKYPFRFFKSFIFRHKIIINFENRFVRNRQKIIPFIQQKLPIKTIRSIENIKLDEFDFIIFGSDQVWRALYWCRTFPNLEDAFGGFVPKTSSTKLISYAASFGRDDINEYPHDKTPSIAKLLKRFKGVSVRENSGVEICKREFGVEAKWVVDPTMLHEKSIYEELCKNIPHKTDFVASYFLEDSELSKEIEKEILKDFNGFHDKIESNVLKNNIRGIEEWLATFRDADFIMTDSFHGAVFSIIFGKPFIVIDNPKRGTGRIRSLLQLFGLENHFIESIDKLEDIRSYNLSGGTSEKLADLRKDSSAWLKEILIN